LIQEVKHKKKNNKKDLVSIKADPWGVDYIYLPKIEWNQILMILEDVNSDLENDLKYHIECILTFTKTINDLPSDINIDTSLLIYLTYNSCVVFSIGNKTPIFIEEFGDIQKEKILNVLSIIKSIREKSGSNLLLQQGIDTMTKKN
jgi:hypothetical protein